MKNIPLYDVRKVKSIKEVLETSTSLYGERTAFLNKRKGNDTFDSITFKQFKTEVDALGTALIDMGLKDCRIAIIGENRYDWVLSYMAVVNGTGIVVPLDNQLPENEIESEQRSCFLQVADADIPFVGSVPDHGPAVFPCVLSGKIAQRVGGSGGNAVNRWKFDSMLRKDGQNAGSIPASHAASFQYKASGHTGSSFLIV